ncbi:MAG: YraN family protein [Actinomycetota bacterium]
MDGHGAGIETSSLGQRGETAAAGWYRSAGYRQLARNWRCRDGELDLVVTDGQTVIFVEVKTRSSGRYGSGFDAVDHRKRRKVRTVAARWLAASDRHWAEIRFDVADVDGRGHVLVREGCF